ncbi:hypothetical protein CPB85DRAFT_1009316 [Mucidula mucida]|nr:hypothetical protein CPB85DRAFT_1009316 [Mucidula mucida]
MLWQCWCYTRRRAISLHLVTTAAFFATTTLPTRSSHDDDDSDKGSYHNDGSNDDCTSTRHHPPTTLQTAIPVPIALPTIDGPKGAHYRRYQAVLAMQDLKRVHDEQS